MDFGDDATGILLHDDDAVAHQDRFLDVVGDHEDRFRRNLAGRPELEQLAAKRLRAEHVERRERFVHAEQLGLDRHRAREPDLLSHAAGQLARIGVLEPIEPDAIEQIERARRTQPGRHAARLERHLDVLLDRQPGKERKTLKHNRGERIHAGEHAAAIQHLPCVGFWRPVIMRSNVLLPQPDGPSSDTNSPAASVRLTS